MDSEDIRQHWTNWAATYGTGLRATTKSWTAKALEIDALSRRLGQLVAAPAKARVLEVGCGNGVNCVELAQQFSEAHFDGVDYIAEMVAAATENARNRNVADRIQFFVGDILQLDRVAGLESEYDIVFTDRCLINLNTIELQKEGISSLAAKVKVGGHLLMIENSTTSHGEQNRCRGFLDLPPRKPADFNLFLDEAEIHRHLKMIGIELIDVEDFSSLHDLMLYVLVPAINGGAVEYDHPLVEAATLLSKELSATQPSRFGAFGQNRLFVCRKVTPRE
jgi:SAM-dependent methyltransferase